MSSWIPALFNPPSSDDDDNPTSPPLRSPASGVKEDLSAVFRGVAAFLAPPPFSSASDSSAASDEVSGVDLSSSSDAISGIKNDLAEIQGSFKSSLSLISSKITSNFLQFNAEQQNHADDDDIDDSEEEDELVGVSEEVVNFVKKVCLRPELWIDFPLSLSDAFDLSDYQKEHAANMEHLVPELATLKQKICSQISNGKFWHIYFILLFPWLDEEDLKILATPEVVEARETLLRKLNNKTDVAQENPEKPESSDTNEDTGKRCSPEGGQCTSQLQVTVAETINSIEKTKFERKMESGDLSRETDTSTNAPEKSENTDYSFSDLEDDDNDLPGHKQSERVTRGEAHEWIQLNESSGSEGSKKKAGKSALKDKESEGEDSTNEWLTVDDSDFDSLAEI